MRPLREIIKDFSSKRQRLSYWLGISDPVEYELSDGRIFKVSTSGRRRLLILSEICGWKRDDQAKTVSIFEADSTLIISDGLDKLGSILERELPECWIIEDESH